MLPICNPIGGCLLHREFGKGWLPWTFTPRPAQGSLSYPAATPRYGEMHATVNPRNNFAHYFCCKKNLNNIDLLLAFDYDFRAAVSFLERWPNYYQAQRANTKTPTRRPPS